MEDYTTESTEDIDNRTKDKKRLITVIVAAALVGLIVFLIFGGANAISCNPQDLSCPGNIPAGTLIAGTGNWITDILSKITSGTLFSIVTTSATTTGTTYTWTDKISAPIGYTIGAMKGVYDQCKLEYRVYAPYGLVGGTTSSLELGYQGILSAGEWQRPNFWTSEPTGTAGRTGIGGSSLSVGFAMGCGEMGYEVGTKVYARFLCEKSPVGRYMTDWSDIPAAMCQKPVVPTPTPTSTPTPITVPCSTFTTGTQCNGQNIERYYIELCHNTKTTVVVETCPSTYYCTSDSRGGTCIPKVSTTPTPTPTPTSTPQCSPVFDKTVCSGNDRRKTSSDCGGYNIFLETCPNGCESGICKNQIVGPTSTPTSTPTPTATSTPTPTATSTPTPTATPTSKMFNDNFSPSQWKDLCGIQDYTKLCPLGANDFDVTEWNNGCPIRYRCISEGPVATPTSTPKQGGGDGEVITTDKGIITGFFDWLNNFIKVIYEALFGKK